MNVFPRIVWILSQLTAFVLKFQQKNLRGQKSIVWKTALVPLYLLTRIWSIIFSCKFFRYFQQAFNSSAQLKDRELWMLVLFLLIILEMHSLVALECAACVCFFRKLWVWEKIHLKFVKPWKMKNLLWDHENGSETVWHMVKPWELRGLYLAKFDDVI